MRRSQRLRNNRILGPGRGIDNPRAVASVMLARAGEHAQTLDDVSAHRQTFLSAVLQNQSLADQSLAMYNMKRLQGNGSGAALAKKQLKKFLDRRKRAARYVQEFDSLAPAVNLALNSVVVEVARHSAAFGN